MKKIIALVLVLVMVFALCACGAEENPKEVLYDKYEGIISSLEAEDYDGAVSAIDSLRPEPEKQPCHEVQITMDNWQDYFEIRTVPLYGSFGDVESYQLTIVPKEELFDKIDFDETFNVAFKYDLWMTGYEFDKNTASCELDNGQMESLVEIVNASNQKEAVDWDKYGSINWGGISGTELDGWMIQVVDVKGSLALYD